jgi:hypothetical protein
MDRSVDIRAERRLLFCCARTTIDEDTKTRITELLGNDIDWTFFVQSAIGHGVLPLVYHSLKQHFLEKVPKEAMNDLRSHHADILRRNLFLLTKLLQVMAILDAHGVSAIPYKGPTLGSMAYRNIGLRRFGDLDILVSPDQYLEAQNLLLERGYLQGVDWGWECSLVDASDGVSVDLHRAITGRSFPINLDFEALKERRKPITVAGREVETLCPEDMLIVLCIQLAKDTGETNPLLLIKICDIAELLRAYPSLDWEDILREAKKLGCLHILSFGLSVSHRLLGAPTPTLPLNPPRQGASDLLCDHLIYKLSKQTAPDYSSRLTPKNFHYRIRERWRDKLYPYWRDVIAPSELDRAFIALPNSLNIFYYAVRPVRVMVDLLERGWQGFKGILGHGK